MSKGLQTPKTSAAAQAAPASNKTLLLVAGDKGGVGKSSLARALADWTMSAGVSLRLYDADDTNPTLARFYPEAEQLLLTAKGLEHLVDWLELPEQVALVDTGARAGRALLEFYELTGFWDLAAQYGAQVIVCFALAPSADSIALLKSAADLIGARAQWVIARSTFIPGTWSLWEGSKTREMLVALGAVEIAVPALDADAYSALDRFSLVAGAGAADPRLPLVYRAYVQRWRVRMAAELARALPVFVRQ